MEHVELFESFGNIPERGLADFKLKEGIGMLVYDIMDVEKLMQLYKQWGYDEASNQYPFGEFLKEMSTPGVYGTDEYGGPWEIVEIGTDFTGFLDKGRYFGMIYRF